MENTQIAELVRGTTANLDELTEFICLTDDLTAKGRTFVEVSENCTIETKAGNIFYIVVDKQKQNDNVDLSKTTETELTALAKEASGESVEHGIRHRRHWKRRRCRAPQLHLRAAV